MFNIVPEVVCMANNVVCYIHCTFQYVGNIVLANNLVCYIHCAFQYIGNIVLRLS